MSEQTRHLVQQIRARLQAAFRRLTLAEFVYGLALTIGLLASALLVATAVEAGFWLDPGPRTAVFWVLLVVAAGLVLVFLARPLLRLIGWLRGPGEEHIAREVGRKYPEVSDRLVNLLQLSEGRGSPSPDAFLDGAIRMLGAQIAPIPFERIEDYRPARHAGRLAVLPVVGLFVFLLAAPGSFLGAANRLFSPGVFFERPAAFRFEVQPGDVELVKGASLNLSARPVGRELPREALLQLRQEGEDRVETLALATDSSGTFRHTFVNVRLPFQYRLTADGVQSPWHGVRVVERPMVRGLQVALDFPAYTRLPARRLDPNVGDVTALPGTRVTLEVALGETDVEQAALLFDDGTEHFLTVEGDQAGGTFTLRRAGTYQILLRSPAGIPNTDAIAYALDVLTDEFPSVVLLEPGPAEDLNEALRVGLHARLNDDFGFSRLRLHYRLAESRFGQTTPDFQSLELPLADPVLLDQAFFYDWLLASSAGLDLVPGDVVEYYLQVWDNDAVAGFKPAQSARHLLRFPSLAEQYEQLETEQDAAETVLDDLLEKTETVREQFEELRDELRQKQEADWEDRRQLGRLMDQQQALDEQVEALQEQVESITDQMAENNLVGEETLELYEELQRVVEEIKSPELMEALKQLQEALENLDLGKMQQALEQFDFNEEQYQKRLERTLELFKRLRTEQKLDQAARMAEELAELQEKLARETERLEREQADQPDAGPREAPREEQENPQAQETGNEAERQDETEGKEGEPNERENPDAAREEAGRTESPEAKREQLAAEQERAQEEMKRLEEQIEALRRQMEELRHAPKQNLQRLQQQMEQQQLPRQMQQNSEQLRQNELDEAQEGQQQMQEQLQQHAQQLGEMKEQMQGNQMQVNMAGLRRALDDVLTLSRNQENLRDTVRPLSPDSPTLRTFAQQQVELSEGLSVVSDTLQQLARDIPQMTREVQQKSGEALQAMGQAVSGMADRQVPQAAGFQKASMTHLNDLALLLSDLLDQMRNMAQSNGQGGTPSLQQMMQQLQQMAGQQQQLNEQIQNLLNDAQGQRLTQSQQERLSQIGRQQEQLRRQLEEMGQNKALGGQVLGDLNKIADQMEETIRELEARQMDRKTVERQQQILTRLLDAQRSLQERGKEKRRESQSGRDTARSSPADLAPTDPLERLRRDLLRALESGYASDYQELIKRYFELLQQQNEGE